MLRTTVIASLVLLPALFTSGCGSPAPVTCNYGGTIYNPGDVFPAGDGCNTCNCDAAGDVACTAAFCGDDGGTATDSAMCPPCVPPPSPLCVGSGPCGCGPYTCPDGGTTDAAADGGLSCGATVACRMPCCDGLCCPGGTLCCSGVPVPPGAEYCGVTCPDG